jgi:hypothetical protein
MKQIVLFFALLLVLASCKNDAKQPDTTTPAPAESAPQAATNDMPGMSRFRGLLMQNQGKTGMLDPVARRIYLVTDSSGTLDAAYQKATAPVRYNSEPVFVVLTGRFLNGGTGTGGQFELFRIDSMLAKTPELVSSVGATFEFWCYGIDSKWDIEISFYEGGIFYQNESDGTAWLCKWTAPKETITSWSYDVKEIPGFSGPMRIDIKKEKVKDNTGKEFNYSVEVQVKGQTLKGVAVRGLGVTQPPNAAPNQ